MEKIVKRYSMMNETLHKAGKQSDTRADVHQS